MKMMSAVVLRDVMPAEQVQLVSVAIPMVRPGWVLIEVKAFGLNHSEQILRLSEIRASYINKPVIPGIECVGIIADASDSHFEVGQKVITMMGGMGRSFNGSYAEYVLVRVTQVFRIESELTWGELAAIPETYFTAWGSLFQGLRLEPADTLLIRGGTSALGYAALQLAKALGCQVLATTHREEKRGLLAAADEVIIDAGSLVGKCPTVTKALELVGPKTLRDTLRLVRQGGIVCHTGVLGGIYTLDGFDPIKEIPNGVYLTSFFSNDPTQEIIDALMCFIREHDLQPHRGATFSFADIRDACIAQDEGRVNGKIVVEL